MKACYQADQTEEVCVEPPAEYLALLAELGRPTDVVWKLLKMLPGQRAAGAGWIKTARARLEGEGFECCPALPQFYFRRADRALIEVHMDDFHGTAPAGSVNALLTRLR